MKMTKRIIAVAMTLLMVATCFMMVASAAFDESQYAFVTVGERQNINETVTYQKYALTSGVYDATVNAVALEFDTKDGYIPMAFMGYAGTSGTLATQYDIATKKYGYEVVGVINGSFFSMDQGTNGQYGTLVDYIISNGKVMSAHAGDACEVVAFASDGTFQTVRSQIDYALYINGESVGSLYYINKTSGTKNANNWGNGFYYFDTSCGRVTDTHDEVEGYNVLCRKINNTDLVVGGTLKGEVISVTKGTEGAQVSDGYDDVSDRFDIFVKATSTNAKYVKDLQPGDSVNIAVSETVEESREIIEKANSVIENVGWLVKDGVDQTKIKSEIGTHSVELKARWTAFGRKADGSYVFFTSDSTTKDGSSYSTGTSLCATLKDVAKAMISLGCVDVIRMDGGGSTAMYADNVKDGEPGYLMATDGYIRPVADCILVVKKPSATDETVTQALKDAAAEAKSAETIETAVQQILDEIDELLDADPNPLLSDSRRLLMKLSAAASGKDELNAVIANAAGVSHNDYSFEALEKIREAYDVATAVFGDAEATAEQVAEATNNLRYWLSQKGPLQFSLSYGASYTVTGGTNYTNFESVMVDDRKRLTDGAMDSLEGTSSAYSAWSGAPEIIVDLGEANNIDTFKVHAARQLDWGISTPKEITVSVSEDGKAYTEVAKETGTETTIQGKEKSFSTTTIGELVDGNGEAEGWNAYVVTMQLEEPVKARYVKFNFKTQGTFLWLTELEACKTVDVVTNAVYITGFNRVVSTGDSCLFNYEVGNLRENNGAVNAKWTQNILLKWDEDNGCYTVVKSFFGDEKAGGGTAPNITLEEDELLLAVHGDSGSDYANRAMAQKQFKKGVKVGLYGVDVENAKLKIAPFARVIPEEELKPKYPKGDITGDGKVNAQDYSLLKRIVLNKYTPNEDQKSRCDVTGDGKVNAQDYALLKRVVLGTGSFTK